MKNKLNKRSIFALAVMTAMAVFAFGFASCSNSSDSGGITPTPTPAGSYTVKVALGIEHGKVTADKTTAAKDATVTLTIAPDEGYALNTITVTKDGGGTVALSGTGNKRTFAMPESNVTVNATFSLTPVKIASGIANGSVTASPDTINVGDTVTLTIDPEEHYVLGSISVTKDDGSAVTLSGTGNTRTFTMPDSNVTVNAMFINTDFKYESDFVSTKFFFAKDVQWGSLKYSDNAVGEVWSPNNPINANGTRTTDSDWTAGSYVMLEANGTTTVSGLWEVGTTTVTKYKITLFTLKPDGTGYTKTVLGDSLYILGIEEQGFMAENPKSDGSGTYGTFFYTQKGWAAALANSANQKKITVDLSAHKYPTLDGIKTYISSIN